MSSAANAPTSDPATLAVYDRKAPVYVASGKGGVSRWLHSFLDLLPASARVLELGCGGGRDTEAMLSRGFDVEPTDGSAAVALKAEDRLGRLVRVMRFDELTGDREYDAIWANASLLHVPRDGLVDVLARVYRALRPGGLHFASYKAGTRPGRDSLGRYFNYPNRSLLGQSYVAAGDWQALSLIDYVGGGYESGDGPWIAITVRKPEKS